MAATVLRWSEAAAKGSCSLRGPQRGERRSTVRTTLAGGVSSPKRGRNGGGGSNSDGGSSALVARCGHEDEGGERRCARAAGEGEKGGKEKGRGGDKVALLYWCGSAAWHQIGERRGLTGEPHYRRGVKMV
jgi:hypothetical protein